MLPRSRSRETATRAVGNGGNSFYVSYDVINGSSFCDNCDAVVPALFCADHVPIVHVLSDCWASSTCFLVCPLGGAAGWTRIGVFDTRSGRYIATHLYRFI